MSRLSVALVVAVGALVPTGGAWAQEPAAAGPRVVIRLGVLDSLAFRLHPALDPGGRLGKRTTPALVAARWETRTRELLVRQRADRFREHLLATFAPPAPVPPDTVVAIPRPADLAPAEPPEPLDALAQFADLGLDLTAHLEMRLDRLRNERCTSVDISDPTSGCRGGFPTPSFDQQFQVRAGGVVSDRMHLNVDFDSEREFSANNNINVWYQGPEDEILRRVEVGNVTFQVPRSRYITAAIPANSFGVHADAQLGPLEFRAIVAQQKGSALRSRTFAVGETTTQPVSFDARELDFEFGRFFFVVNPLSIPGYPDVDILNIDALGLPLALRPTAVRIYRLRAQRGRQEDNPNLGGIDAVAIRPDSPQRIGPFSWELLVEGRDYYLDPSGTWFALATRAGTEDFLAVSYVAASGDRVGTFPAVNGLGDTLQLIYEPRRGPQVPTFNYEMRNVYRVGGSDIERSSIQLSVVVNESEQPLDGVGTYLSRLRIALQTDASTLDEFNRVFPRPRDPNSGVPIRDLFVVFPHLMPFADSARLLAGERNDSLYRTPTYLLGSQGPPPKFALRFHYETTGSGDRSTLSLGAFQVREGSERLFIGDRQLQRGRDYEIDYGLGLIQFLNPDSLFFGPTEVLAQFEENQLFDLAPTNIFGLTTTYHLGPHARVHAVGMLQRDRSNFTRPQLGFEPQSHFIGGVSTELEFRPDGLTRVLDALPLIETSVPSRLDIRGEIALSQPNSNQADVAYVEDYEQEAALKLGLVDREYQLGSAPSSGRGLPASHLGPGGMFIAADAVPLIWQNSVRSAGGVLEFGPEDIDSTLVFAGTGFQVETVLWLSLKPDTVGGAPDPQTGAPRWIRSHTPGPRWRSISRPLGGGSGVGIDLSRIESLEFWVLEDADRTALMRNATLVFDFGTVFEDAADVAPTSFSVAGGDTVFTGVRQVGQGRLDTEKDTLANVFNALVDDNGIRADLLDTIVNANTGQSVEDLPLCDLQGLSGLVVFPRGDLQATCTRRNGRLDTEDLNGDNRLDVTVGAIQEDVFRYVFPIGEARYFVRTGGTRLDERGRPLTWRLYRIPFREDTVQVGTPNIRQVAALRLTLVAPDQGPTEDEFFIALARMRLLGAPWLKRAATPIAGLSGSQGEPRGEVAVSVVGTENQDLGYTSPPGVANLPDQRGAEFQFGPTQINERALRVLARDLRVGERAEALTRFTGEADKNFLAYRTLRVWARGRGAGWAEGDLEFYIKVGRDEHNFYFYRAPLRTDTWEPEVTIDLDRWLALRTEIEAAWLGGAPPSGAAVCGGDSTAFVACDGPYLVHIRDPGISPPNLARVSEVAVGMLRVRQTVVIDPAEVWVNDIRLSDVVDDIGLAAAIDARLSAADVAEVALTFTSRDGQFRQLGENPTYITDAVTRISSVIRLDKLLPAGWGLSMPLTVQYLRTRADPFYVNFTDVRADALPSLRRPRRSGTTYEVAVRRTTPGRSALARALVDPLLLHARYQTAENVASLNRSTSTNRRLRGEYNTIAGAQSIPGAPGFLVRLVNSLPEWIRESEFGRALRSSRLRLNPYRIRLASTFTNNVTERFTFRVPVELAGDTALAPLPSIVHTWRNEAGIELRPYSSFTFRVNYTSTRDLQDYGDSTTVARLLERERREVFGSDVGFERARALTTALSVQPVISSWLRPRFALMSRYAFSRDPNRQEAVRDTSGGFRVPETLANFRRQEVGTSVDLGRLASGATGEPGLVAELLGAILPADISYAVERRSSYDRSVFTPNFRYQLALGGLDEFRFQQGIPATAAGEATRLTGTGGTRLPLGAQVRLSYRNVRNTVWARRGNDQTQIVQRNREWPAFAFSWVYSPQWVLGALVTTVTAQAQYRVVKSSSAARDASGSAPGVVTENNSVFVAPSLTLTWIGGITTSAQYTAGTSETVTAGNVTDSDRREWGARVSFSFRPPQSLVRLRNRILTTVTANSSKLAVCLLRSGTDECRAVSDSRRRQFDLRIDTGFSPALHGGLTLSYVLTDQRHTSNKLSQLVFTIFADINLLAGRP